MRLYSLQLLEWWFIEGYLGLPDRANLVRV